MFIYFQASINDQTVDGTSCKSRNQSNDTEDEETKENRLQWTDSLVFVMKDVLVKVGQ